MPNYSRKSLNRGAPLIKQLILPINWSKPPIKQLDPPINRGAPSKKRGKPPNKREKPVEKLYRSSVFMFVSGACWSYIRVSVAEYCAIAVE
ncbi:hypothetical protein [Virgibacillus ihumii]|uniref:hypothetical protein n=1 Tax=Virgibacillus ihumii TaxID=2686091 RepID=UPI00157D7F3C|nr:hypothetical protein [Virgibacillus ihumii]